MALTRRPRALAVPLTAVAALVVSSLSIGAASATGASSGPSGRFTVKAGAITQTGSVTGSKSVTGRLAHSNAALLKRTDSAVVPVMVKLDYDATASYAGGVRGLAATSPRVTGKKLTGKS